MTLLDAYSLMYFSIIGCDLSNYPDLKDALKRQGQKTNITPNKMYFKYFEELEKTEYWVS